MNQNSELSTQHSALITQHSELSTYNSALRTQHFLLLIYYEYCRKYENGGENPALK
ncbi:hypothetical protein [Dulcicalothrix desertica]|uniref:hypothetical protein n=1 Tax=Dulcicalothrix desertica TaxID=32056 RepID=UPI001476D172|nr:hypothetical protein [Dulcicalothrix desertica]